MADTELDAGKSAPREEASLDFSFVVSGVWPLLLAGFIFRIIIGAIPGTAFQIDTGTFTAWSNRLADQHPWNFYSPDLFSDYAPGYLYVLWFFGELNAKLHFGPDTFEFILKLPSIFADVGIAYVLYLFLEKERSAWRLGAVAAYLLFPPALLNGAVWGQVDSLSVFFLMLSIYWISRDKPAAGAAAYVVGFVTKPQIIAALPFLAFWIMRKHPPRWVKGSVEAWQWLLGWVLLLVGAGVGAAAYAIDPDKYEIFAAVGGAAFLAGVIVLGAAVLRQPDESEGYPSRRPDAGVPVPPRIWLGAAAAGGVLLCLLVLPFFPDYPWDFITQLKSSADVPNYRVGSFWAYNFWGIWGFFKPDNTEYMGLTYQVWGLSLFAISTLAILYSLRNAQGDWALALGTALCLLAFYIFLTRMHERYMFPALVPFLAACFLNRNPLLCGTVAVLAVVHFLNLYHVYSYYPLVFPPSGQAPDEPIYRPLFNFLEDQDMLGTGWRTVKVMSALVFISFPVLLATCLLDRRLRDAKRA